MSISFMYFYSIHHLHIKSPATLAFSNFLTVMINVHVQRQAYRKLISHSLHCGLNSVLMYW